MQDHDRFIKSKKLVHTCQNEIFHYNAQNVNLNNHTEPSKNIQTKILLVFPTSPSDLLFQPSATCNQGFLCDSMYQYAIPAPLL